MANNKVQLSDGTVLLDLTGDTVTPETLLSGVTAHDAAGNPIVGTVVGIKLTGIAITTPPKKTAYKPGETFDSDGMVVTATYSNGAKLTSPSYTFSPAGALTAGDKAITITYTEGGVTKTATQAITVTVPIASTSAVPGVTYTAGLSGLEASDVTAFAEAISKNSDITNETTTVYVDFGSVHRKISVGDQVTLPLDGTNYAFDVIGFNHDTLTTPTAYGAATATGKAGITFQMHDLFATNFVMNDNQTNAGGWKSSKMRTSTMVTMKVYLPAAWQTAIKPVNKLSGVGGGASSGTEVVSDDCFSLAEGEIFGSGYGYGGNGYSFDDECAKVTQYAYYKAGNSKVKNQNGSARNWWERSPLSGGNRGFCRVTNGGNAASDGAKTTYGVAFGFCV